MTYIVLILLQQTCTILLYLYSFGITSADLYHTPLFIVNQFTVDIKKHCYFPSFDRCQVRLLDNGAC